MKKEYVGPACELNEDIEPMIRYHQECHNCGQEFLSQRVDRICQRCSGVEEWLKK